MKRLFLLSVLLLAGLQWSPADAQTTLATTVSACGTPPNTPVVGNSYSITQDTTGKQCTNATVTVGFVATTATNASSTITTGGAFQSALASNVSRKGCLIQNPVSATETLYVYFGATGSATTASSITLGPGAAVSCAVGGLGVATDNVAVEAATTGHAFVEMSQ